MKRKGERKKNNSLELSEREVKPQAFAAAASPGVAEREDAPEPSKFVEVVRRERDPGGEGVVCFFLMLVGRGKRRKD